MAILRDPFFSIGGTDLSNSVSAVNVGPKANTEEATASGDAWMTYEAGLKMWDLSIDFWNTFGGGGFDATLFPMVGTEQPVVIRPQRAARGGANPEYTGDVIVTDYPILANTVGSRIGGSLAFQPTGPLARAT